MTDQDTYDAIMEYAHKMATDIEKEYPDPKDEFVAWLTIGLERESLVASAYDNNHIQKHLKKMKLSKELNALITETIGIAWAQEVSHVGYVKSALSVLKPGPNWRKRLDGLLQKIKYDIKNDVFKSLTQGNTVKYFAAKLAILLGQQVAELPAFINHLKKGDFKDFCLMNMVLEETAILGYGKMVGLAEEIITNSNNSISHTPVFNDLKYIHKQENYHYKLFEYFSNYPPPAFIGPTPPLAGSLKSTAGPGPLPGGGNTLFDRCTGDIKTIQLGIWGPASQSGMDKIVVDELNISQDPLLLEIGKYLRTTESSQLKLQMKRPDINIDDLEIKNDPHHDRETEASPGR